MPGFGAAVITFEGVRQVPHRRWMNLRALRLSSPR
jgi:hypothetical protein